MQQFMVNDHLRVVDGKRIRVGPVLKTEFSSSMGMTHKYVWCELVHKNDEVMKHIVALGYKKHSRFISRKIAAYLAKHFDVYIEGISEDVISDL